MQPSPVINLSLVSYFVFGYSNNKETFFEKKPKCPMVNGQVFNGDELAGPHPDYPGETLAQRAERRGLLDVWEPRIQITMSNGHNIAFYGDKAIKIHGLLWNKFKNNQPRSSKS